MQSAAINNLDSSLQLTPITTRTKHDISFALWGNQNPPPNRATRKDGPDAYFMYYTHQSDLFEPGRQSWAKTHRDIIDIATLLRQGLKRDEVRQELRAKLQHAQLSRTDQFLDGSIDLTIRLLLMMKVGDLSDYYSAYKALTWEQGPTLREFVCTRFPSRGAFVKERVRLDRCFIAKNLSRLAGMKIIWTDNFADHLRILDEDTEVAIFHHASFLEKVRSTDLYPPGLIDETLRTLALLFPPTDDTRTWFQKLALEERVDMGVIKCGQLRAEDRQIDAFKFWRDRLVILKQIFDEKEPTSWLQWWHDKRRGLQRYPFLLAAIALTLSLVIGLIQCVVGAVQVYKAYYPS